MPVLRQREGDGGGVWSRQPCQYHWQATGGSMLADLSDVHGEAVLGHTVLFTQRADKG